MRPRPGARSDPPAERLALMRYEPLKPGDFPPVLPHVPGC